MPHYREQPRHRERAKVWAVLFLLRFEATSHEFCSPLCPSVLSAHIMLVTHHLPATGIAVPKPGVNPEVYPWIVLPPASHSQRGQLALFASSGNVLQLRNCNCPSPCQCIFVLSSWQTRTAQPGKTPSQFWTTSILFNADTGL